MHHHAPADTLSRNAGTARLNGPGCSQAQAWGALAKVVALPGQMEMELGRKLRRFLVDQVLPQIAGTARPARVALCERH
jgi:hypothetical protein